MANLDFDFRAFANSAIKAIDEIRSTGSEGKSVVESRINAFYRSIGLPSLRDPNSTSKTDQFNVSNAFDPGQQLADQTNAVTIAAITGRNRDFQRPATQQEFAEAMHLGPGSIKDNLDKRKRGAMWPTVVDGGIEVKPQNKRIASPYAKEKDTLIDNGSDKMKRPMIEFVINTRSRTLGDADTTYSDKVLDDFKNTFGVTTIKADSGNTINLRMAAKLRGGILTAIEDYNQSIKQAGKVFKDAGDIAIVPEDNIPAQNPDNAGNVLETQTSLEIQDQYQLEKDRINQGFLTLFQYSDGDGTGRRNLEDGMFVSNMVSLLAAEDVKTKSDKDTGDAKKEKATTQIKQSMQGIDLFTGQFAGISGLDILIVFAALFEVPIEVLVGLLNPDAKKQFNEKKPNSTAIPVVAITDALTQLHNKLTELYDFADQNVTKTTH
jgi:hypothetical protein